MLLISTAYLICVPEKIRFITLTKTGEMNEDVLPDQYANNIMIDQAEICMWAQMTLS